VDVGQEHLRSSGDRLILAAAGHDHAGVFFNIDLV
jgi:hypothetical protein